MQTKKKKTSGTIKEYLKNNGLRQDWFAEQLGVTSAQLSGYALSRILPTPPMLVKMHDMTNGEISIEAMVREHAICRPWKWRKKKEEEKKDTEPV